MKWKAIAIFEMLYALLMICLCDSANLLTWLTFAWFIGIFAMAIKILREKAEL